MKTIWLMVWAMPVLWLATGCVEVPERHTGDRLRIVCTTGMIGDAVSRIAGSKAEVSVLMGPGVDPHLYKATQGDLHLLSHSDVIFYNGLHLEGKMGEVLHKFARNKKIVALAELLPPESLLMPAGETRAHDPHIWFDVSLWAEVVRHAGRELAAADPVHKDLYLGNASRYAAELDSLHRWVGEQMAGIPDEQRILVTAHDAFGYFGRAYGMEVRGLQGISTASEYGLRDVSDLVGFLTERKIKAVFVESSVPSKSLEAVVEGCSRRGHQVAVGGHLFSDAMGQEGTQEGTYAGMVKANVQTIAKALQ